MNKKTRRGRAHQKYYYRVFHGEEQRLRSRQELLEMCLEMLKAVASPTPSRLKRFFVYVKGMSLRFLLGVCPDCYSKVHRFKRCLLCRFRKLA